MATDLEKAVAPILDLYDRVATGESLGARGSFYANGRGTLADISVPVELVEDLARAVGRTVHGRDCDYRESLAGK